MTRIRHQFSDAELEAVLRVTQLMLDETRGFRIAERKSGLSVSELVDIKRKIEQVLGLPSMPLVNASAPEVTHAVLKASERSRTTDFLGL